MLIPGTLLAILAVLIVIPFAVLVYASLVTALPFSGNTDVSWTLADSSRCGRPQPAVPSSIR